jgi:Glycosyl transferase family 2
MLEKLENARKSVLTETPNRKWAWSASTAVLPISVIIPTRNAGALMPGHLASMRRWIDLAQEVVVVDSGSTDGTVELLRKGLKHPCVRFLNHPPGIYQSWNFAINQANAEACYISTVGETITPEGLQHLAEVLQETRCDAVISRPEFVDVEGGLIAAPQWPIDDILATLRPQRPLVLEGASLFFFTLLNYANAILGSSASNLYRTRTLQRRPFPLDYGTVGDGAWCLRNCFDVRIAVTPERSSTFREHPKSYAPSEYAVEGLTQKLFDLVERTYRQHLQAHPEFLATAADLQIERVLDLLQQQRQAQARLEAARASSWPWVLNRLAWRARAQRNALVRQLRSVKSAGVRHLFPPE